MKFLAALFATKSPQAICARFPNFDNVSAWMEERVAFVATNYPQNLSHLFCPSMADYLPLVVTSATSQKHFFGHIETYKALKNKYPQAVKEAKENVVDWSIFNGGPQEDYPR